MASDCWVCSGGSGRTCMRCRVKFGTTWKEYWAIRDHDAPGWRGLRARIRLWWRETLARLVVRMASDAALCWLDRHQPKVTMYDSGLVIECTRCYARLGSSRVTYEFGLDGQRHVTLIQTEGD